MENKNPIVYVSVDKSLLLDVVCDVYPWLQELGFEVVDLVDAYTTENYPEDKRDERLKKKDRASVYLFVAEHNKEPWYYSIFIKDAQHCEHKRLPLILMRYKGCAEEIWKGCPRHVLNPVRCCCGYDQESLRKALIQVGVIEDCE